MNRSIVPTLNAVLAVLGAAPALFFGSVAWVDGCDPSLTRG